MGIGDHSGHGHSDHDHAGHGHSHQGHSHHGHSHAPADFGRAFVIGIALNSIFIAFEVFYGLKSNSLALLADAGHNLSDVLGLFMAWYATVLARRAATVRHTYGYKRTSVMAAILNAIFLLVSVGGIAWESIVRFQSPMDIESHTVAWVATLGIVINAATAFMFMSGSKQDLNIRGAYLHMAADAAISAGVVVAAVVISLTNWVWLDPAVSLLISAVIIVGTWSLLRDSVNLSLDAVPQGIDIGKVQDYFLQLPAVVEMHHLHVWGLSTTETALTVHLVLNGEHSNDLLLNIHQELDNRFGITHATIQFESAAQQGCGAKECH